MSSRPAPTRALIAEASSMSAATGSQICASTRSHIALLGWIISPPHKTGSCIHLSQATSTGPAPKHGERSSHALRMMWDPAVGFWDPKPHGQNPRRKVQSHRIRWWHPQSSKAELTSKGEECTHIPRTVSSPRDQRDGVDACALCTNLATCEEADRRAGILTTPLPPLRATCPPVWPLRTHRKR